MTVTMLPVVAATESIDNSHIVFVDEGLSSAAA